MLKTQTGLIRKGNELKQLNDANIRVKNQDLNINIQPIIEERESAKEEEKQIEEEIKSIEEKLIEEEIKSIIEEKKSFNADKESLFSVKEDEEDLAGLDTARKGP